MDESGEPDCGIQNLSPQKFNDFNGPTAQLVRWEQLPEWPQVRILTGKSTSNPDPPLLS